MSAAVARHQQQQQTGSGTNTGSRMESNSPVDKRISIKSEDKPTRSPTQSNRESQHSRILSPKTSHRRTASVTSQPPSVTVEQPSEQNGNGPSQTNGLNSEQSAPPHNPIQPTLLPPPPPADILEKPSGDYFTFHKRRLDEEPNPFEQSFSNTGNGENNTPKAILPPASAITSPAPLMGAPTFGFMSSLRSGPLSPVMLQGPISSTNSLAFDTHIRSGLTPNESGIRSGLTPGGSGSMFPVASPSPAGFLQFGSSTPSTMEFQKAALSAASALRKQHPPPALNPIQPPLTKPDYPPAANEERDQNNQEASKPRQLSNAFDTDPAHHAASGLFMLAQAHQQNDQFAANSSGAPAQATGPPTQVETSPNSKKRPLVTNTSMTRGNGASSSTGHVRGVSEISEDVGSDSDDSDEMKGNNRSGDSKNGKRGASARARKESKSNKRTKISQGSTAGSGDDQDNNDPQNENSKKMTDEEKRKNFLERNRVAALKCRQRKKQWLQNLQTKVEYYSQENDALTSQVASLREEIVALKTLLLAHKDCPIARATNMGMDQIHNTLAGAGDYGNHANFGSMGVIPPPSAVHGHPRRYS